MASKKQGKQEEKVPEVKIVKFTRSLPVKLTDEELLSRGDRAAYLDRREEEITAAANAAKSDYKHQLEAVVAERRSIQERIRSKTEHREVDCEERFEYRTGRVTQVRSDTGEVLNERAMTDSERQLESYTGPEQLDELASDALDHLASSGVGVKVTLKDLAEELGSTPHEVATVLDGFVKKGKIGYSEKPEPAYWRKA